MDLGGFLNPILVGNRKVVVSDRFIGDDGEPMEWEVRAISSQEDEEIRKSCTKYIPISGKKGQHRKETDTNKYIGAVAVACTIFPPLNNVELQDKYEVMSADELLKAMLLPGEYSKFIGIIQEMNGYKTTQELVDDAKN